MASTRHCCSLEADHDGPCRWWCSGCTGTGRNDDGTGDCPDCDGHGWFDSDGTPVGPEDVG